MAEALAGSGITRKKSQSQILDGRACQKKADKRGAEYPSDVEDKFRGVFPTICGLIRRINKNGWEYENVIRELRRAELRLAIETVTAGLVSRIPDVFVITLHDAIYTTDASIGDVVNEFEAATGNISFRMWFKVELAPGTA